jgi:hypothetical protein
VSRAAPDPFHVDVDVAVVMKVFLERRADLNGQPGARVLENCEAR